MLIETTVGATCDKIEIVADKEYEYPKEMKGKHYEALVEDDMTDAWKYAMSAMKEKQFADINKEIQESIREKCSVGENDLRDDPMCTTRRHYDALIIDDMNIGEQESYEDYKKKGDDKMSKYLWHVILFNTDTEQIDFKGYIPASSGSDAQMLAAQTFGKFDPKVHAVNCKQIMSYGKED